MNRELPTSFYNSFEEYQVANKYQRNWLDKLITHNRDKVGDFGSRVVLHIPIGLIAGIPIIGKPVRELLIRYEENEDAHSADQAWKDYAGAIAGAIITSLASLAGIIWLALKLIEFLENYMRLQLIKLMFGGG